jgi:hypothetical protein
MFCNNDKNNDIKIQDDNDKLNQDSKDSNSYNEHEIESKWNNSSNDNDNEYKEEEEEDKDKDKDDKDSKNDNHSKIPTMTEESNRNRENDNLLSSKTKSTTYTTISNTSQTIINKSNVQTVPSSTDIDNPSTRLYQQVLLVGCFSLFVLLLLCITKKIYSTKKDEFIEPTYSVHSSHKSRSNNNGSKHSLKNLTTSTISNFSFKNLSTSGRKSRELIPSILKVSPAPLASLSVDDLSSKYNENSEADKDINVNESIIQVQSFERNSMNFNDIKTLSWKPMSNYQYDINDTSHTSITDVNEVDHDNYVNDTSKLDNAVDFYFSNKNLYILRQNSSSANSAYSNVPDNTSSTGEPSLSRYIDNDALLKYESSKCKNAMNNPNSNPNPNLEKFESSSNVSSNYNSYKNKNSSYIGNRNSLSSIAPSLSRFSIRNISSSIFSRNNRIHDSNSNDYTSSDNSNFFNNNNNQKDHSSKVRYSYSTFQSSNTNLLNKKQKHRYTLGADINDEYRNLNYKLINQKSLPIDDINLVKPKISTSPSLSSQSIQDKSKFSLAAVPSYSSFPINDKVISSVPDDLANQRKAKSSGSLKYHTNTNFVTNTTNTNINTNTNTTTTTTTATTTITSNEINQYNEGYSSDSSSDLEEELADITHHQQEEANQSTLIDLNNPSNPSDNNNPNLNIAIPQITYKKSLENDLPTIIVNSQNTASCPNIESVHYHY